MTQGAVLAGFEIEAMHAIAGIDTRAFPIRVDYSSCDHQGVNPTELAWRPCSSITTSIGNLSSKNHSDRASMRRLETARGLNTRSFVPRALPGQAPNWSLSNGLKAFRGQHFSSQSSRLLCLWRRSFAKPTTQTAPASSITHRFSPSLVSLREPIANDVGWPWNGVAYLRAHRDLVIMLASRDKLSFQVLVLGSACASFGRALRSILSL
jgi:hypothetical protein